MAFFKQKVDWDMVGFCEAPEKKRRHLRGTTGGPGEFRGRAEPTVAGLVQPLAMVVAQFEKEYRRRILQTAGSERVRAAELVRISLKKLW